jgi:hypothetical protein
LQVKALYQAALSRQHIFLVETDLIGSDVFAEARRAKAEAISIMLDNGDGFAKRSTHPHDRLPHGLFNVPDGQITSPSNCGVSSLSHKDISVFPKSKSSYMFSVLTHRGAARDRHGRGAGCGGRKGRHRRGRFVADGEDVWS